MIKINNGMEDQTHKNARKGTKSCTECRRRKVRCIRTSEDAPICRSCEERGTKCIPQLHSSQPARPRRLPSRHRISQLESKVANLSKALRDVQLKLGYQSTQTLEPAPAHPGSNPESDDSGDDSTVSDVLPTDSQSHLRSLFQNDWLSVDTSQQNNWQQDRNEKSSTHLLDVGRKALQELIPTRDEVSDIVRSRSVSRWLDLLHTLLPQPFAVKSRQEMLETYDEMHNPEVDTIILASWLLTVALTAQQIPLESDSPAIQLKGFQKHSSFPRAVCDIVESTILRHDRLICTIKGLGMAMHLFRLQMSLGNYQKTWLRLRHIIAIAELMGLPRACQSVQLNRANGVVDSEAQVHRAQLWESMCSADSLCGMVINLPPCTSLYKQRRPQELAIDGIVQPRAYLARLTDIAAKIQYRDDTNPPQGLNVELYASVLDLDRQLKVLAAQTPRAWWVQNAEHVNPDHIVQFLHCCINMRIHMSFAMRQDPGEQFVYSRLNCREACESVVERYQFLRRELPSGIFISFMLDLQAFTAAIVLLLTSYDSPLADRSDLQINTARVDSLVAQVVTLMDEKTKDAARSNFAQHGLTTIRSLNKLLQQNGDEDSELQELTLKVPLLGKLHVRRNKAISQVPPITNNPPSFPILSNPNTLKPEEQFATQDQGFPPLQYNDAPAVSAFPTQGDWQWDPLSWSIEDQYEEIFQDTLMSEDIDPFVMNQNIYNDFQFDY